MPKQTPDFDDKQFTAVTGEGTPTEAEPGVVIWKPTYEPGANPVLEINLVNTGATLTPLLQYITALVTAAKDITIRVFRTEDTTVTPVYSITRTIPDDGTPMIIYFSPADEMPIEASIVQIELGEPKNPDETTYDTAIALYGCFEAHAGN